MKMFRLLFWLIHSETYPTVEKNVEKTFFLIKLIILPLIIFPFDLILRFGFSFYYEKYNIPIIFLLFLCIYLIYTKIENKTLNSFIINEYHKVYLKWKNLNNTRVITTFIILFFISLLICRITYLFFAHFYL
jgi:hypothetical protein